MSGLALVCRAAPIASVGIAMPAEAHESAIPNFTSTISAGCSTAASTSCQLRGRLYRLGLTQPGGAELACRGPISIISLPKRDRVRACRAQAASVRGRSSGLPMPRTPI